MLTAYAAGLTYSSRSVIDRPLLVSHHINSGQIRDTLHRTLHILLVDNRSCTTGVFCVIQRYQFTEPYIARIVNQKKIYSNLNCFLSIKIVMINIIILSNGKSVSVVGFWCLGHFVSKFSYSKTSAISDYLTDILVFLEHLTIPSFYFFIEV